MFVFHLHNIIERKLGDRGAAPLPIMYIKHQTFLQKLLQIFFPILPPNMFQIQSNLPYSWGHLYQGLLSQFLWTKISFSRLLICNLHWCRLVRILAKEKMHYISTWDLVIPRICHVSSPIVGNIVSCLFHHCNKQFVSFTSTWNHWNNKSS